MSSLDKRLSYLGIADFDYLSARLLMVHGLVFSALPKAAEAIEKLIKLFILLEAKINRNEDLSPSQLKAYGHNLSRLFDLLKSKVPAKFGSDWDGYIKLLQDSYGRRYPENWDVFEIKTSVHQLDSAYCYLRNCIILNFPPEEQVRARHFGTFIYDSYSIAIRNLIEHLGGRPPGEILRLSNESFSYLDSNTDRL